MSCYVRRASLCPCLVGAGDVWHANTCSILRMFFPTSFQNIMLSPDRNRPATGHQTGFGRGSSWWPQARQPARWVRTLYNPRPSYILSLDVSYTQPIAFLELNTALSNPKQVQRYGSYLLKRTRYFSEVPPIGSTEVALNFLRRAFAIRAPTQPGQCFGR